MNLSPKPLALISSTIVAIACAAIFASVCAAQTGVSEASSAPFALQLGPRFANPLAAIGEDNSAPTQVSTARAFKPLAAGMVEQSSAPTVLALAPPYHVLQAALDEGDGAPFELALGLGFGRGIYPAITPGAGFTLDIRLLVVTLPAGEEVWETGPGTPSHSLSWRWLGGSVDHFRATLEYSLDGGTSYRSAVLDSHVAPGTNPYSISVPTSEYFNTPDSRVVVEAMPAAGTALESATSDQIVLANRSPVRLCVTRNNQNAIPPPILIWDRVPTAQQYRLELTSIYGTACAPSVTETWYVPAGQSMPWDSIESELWRTLPAARFKVAVTVVGGPSAGSRQDLPEFVRYKLDDETPNSNSSNPPVILVHGWTSNNSTWFQNCNFSPSNNALIDELGSGNGGEAFHAWAFEYPNIGPIRHSAAGLRAAVEYIRAQYPPYSEPPKVRLIAHSMGGLVCRTYLQGFAVSPADDANYGVCGNAQPVTTVSHLATLSSPLVGMGRGVINAGAAFHSQVDCAGIMGSASLTDLDDEAKLVADLNCAPLPASTKYFFAGGTDQTSYWVGIPGKFLEHDCLSGNDGVVDVCSARGESCAGGLSPGGHPKSVRFEPGAAIIRTQYALNHTVISVPGTSGRCVLGVFVPYTALEAARDASTDLLDDLSAFLQCAPSCPSGKPCPTVLGRIATFVVKRFVPWPGSGPFVVSAEDRAGVRIADAVPSAVPGALLQIAPVGTAEGDRGAWMSADSLGQVGTTLEPGSYFISIRAKGYTERTDTLAVAEGSSDIIRTLSLNSIPSYAGPIHPTLSVSGGAPSVADSTVELALSCERATEMMVSDSPGFSGALWQPMAPTLGFTLRGGPRSYRVRAKYRDALGVESDSVQVDVELVEPDTGSLAVVSSPVSGQIILDGAPTGRQSPATIEPLAKGYHLVTVQAPGYSATPSIMPVFIDSAATASASFTMIPSGAPEATNWISPSVSAYVSGSGVLEWTRSTDPDAGDQVFYNISILNGAQTATVWFLQGTSASSLPLPNELGDSTSFLAVVSTVDAHGVPQSAPAATVAFSVDRTPPTVRVVAPSEQSAALVGSMLNVEWASGDWSGVDSLTALLSRDGGASFPDTVFHGEANDSLFAWTVTGPIAADCWMRVVAYDKARNARAVDHGPFRISTATATEDAESVPIAFALHPNRPNPFNPRTTIAYDLPAAAHVRMRVFDGHGRLVKTLVDAHKPAGRHLVVWDGTGSAGAPVASGIYFVRFGAAEFGATRKVALLK